MKMWSEISCCIHIVVSKHCTCSGMGTSGVAVYDINLYAEHLGSRNDSQRELIGVFAREIQC